MASSRQHISARLKILEEPLCYKAWSGFLSTLIGGTSYKVCDTQEAVTTTVNSLSDFLVAHALHTILL